MTAQIPCLEYSINHYIYKVYSSLHNGTIHSQHVHAFEIIGKERLFNILLPKVAQNDLRCIRRVCNTTVHRNFCNYLCESKYV